MSRQKGYKHSEVTKLKIGKTLKGYKHSEEFKEKIRLARLGTHRSEETKQKIREAHKGEKNHFYGKHHTEEEKLKIGLGNKGKIVSEESKFKMSEAKKGNTYWLGKKHSEETLLKMSELWTDEKKRKMSKDRQGSKSYLWKGGKIKDVKGYIHVKSLEHPFKDANGYILEHRLVMEKIIGRYLLPEEVVHHKNEIKDDNRPENLRLFENDNEHKKYHKLLREAV